MAPEKRSGVGGPIAADAVPDTATIEAHMAAAAAATIQRFEVREVRVDKVFLLVSVDAEPGGSDIGSRMGDGPNGPYAAFNS